MRKILIVTERRADYSRFKPILKEIKKSKNLDYLLVVTGNHLMEEHGLSINEIIEDGWRIDESFQMFLEEGDKGSDMVKGLGRAIIELSDIVERLNPSIILSGFDIAANFAVAIVGAHMNIHVAHIQGGEVTGTIDESIRHSMTKFAHFHFAANEDACQRLEKLGEVKESIFNVGCPSIDAILEIKENSKILDKYGLDDDYFLVLQHPVTTERNKSREQIINTIKAIKESGKDALVILPNNDAGHSEIIKEIKNSGLKSVETLSIEDYVNLLKRTIALVGNSSSGIHEASTFDKIAINIGTRQNGRLRSSNVIDVNYEKTEILKALKFAIGSDQRTYEKPYGNGNSAKEIVKILEKIDLTKINIQKTITY